MSDDIYALIGRLRSYMRSSKYIITEDIYAAVDTIEALRAERDRLKDEVERLRGEQRLKSLIGPSEGAVERIIAERDSLREVVNNLSCNWIDCPDCDRNRELIESFINKEEKKGE